MRPNYFIPVFFCFVCFSCTTQNDNLEKVKFTVKVNPDKALEVPLSKIVDSINFVNLGMPDSIYTGGITELKVYGNKIYLLDGDKSASILSFSLSGDFLWQVNRKGKGHGEYPGIQNLAVDEKAGELLVYSRQSKRIYYYSTKDGKYLRNADTHQYLYNIEYLNNDHLLFVGDEDASDESYTGIQIWKSDLSKNVVKNLFISPAIVEATLTSSFNTIGEDFFYSQPLNGITYLIKDNSFIPWLKIDFGDKSFPNELLNNKDTEKLGSETNKKHYALAPHLLYKNGDHLSFWHYYGTTNRNLVIANAKTGKNISISKIVNDFGFGEIPIPFGRSGKFYICLLYPYQLKAAINGTISSVNEKLQSALQSSKDEGNPILMYFSIKENIDAISGQK